MGRRNVRKIRQNNTPIPATASFASARFANADGESNSNNNNNNNSGNSSEDKWQKGIGIAKGISDILVGIYDGIVDPILFGGGKYNGQVTIQQQKDNTTKYLIVGGVIIVALVLIIQFAKK